MATHADIAISVLEFIKPLSSHEKLKHLISFLFLQANHIDLFVKRAPVGLLVDIKEELENANDEIHLQINNQLSNYFK